jgi:hypothetical protein
MHKNLSGNALINYGAELPDPSTAYDGALFYKTSNPGSGLYVFGFIQDSNANALGDQVRQGWVATTPSEQFINKEAGGVVTGDITVQSPGPIRGLRVVNMKGDGGGSISANTPTAGGITLSGEGGPINFITGNESRMTLDVGGNLTLNTGIGNGKVWTSLNDGQGSGLDADLLDGLDAAYFTNASNINAGTINLSRLPFTPVQQGGGPGQQNNKVNIGWNGSNRLLVSVDTNPFNNIWPIDINGDAATAQNAANAANAISARGIRNAGNPNDRNLIFTWDAKTNPNWLWGGVDGTNMYVYSPSQLSVNYANTSDTSNRSLASNYADNAGNANYATNSNRASTAGFADSAGNASRAQAADYADNAGNVANSFGKVKAWVSIVDGNYLEGNNISSVSSRATNSGAGEETDRLTITVNFVVAIPTSNYALVSDAPIISSGKSQNSVSFQSYYLTQSRSGVIGAVNISTLSIAIISN